jgi:hypothetical protein
VKDVLLLLLLLRLASTRYDCSAADINPIGGISKGDLRRFLKWAAVHLGYSHLADVEAAPPTAELEPIRWDPLQLDDTPGTSPGFELRKAHLGHHLIHRPSLITAKQQLCGLVQLVATRAASMCWSRSLPDST